LEDLDIEVDIYSAWETIRENIKFLAKEFLGYYKLKNHRPWAQWMYKIIRTKKAHQIAVVTGSKRNKWG
jgi:hypothetical protein